MARSWEDRNRGSLSIGGLQPFVFTWSDTQIVAVVPPSTTSGLVQVSQGGQTSNSLNFIVAAPNITGVSPVNGAPGTQVTFSGSGFGASQGTGNVLLGTNLGAIISWSDTQIVATVTTGSSSGRAQVLQGGIASNFVAFTVSGSAPVISTVSPSTGVTGVQVTVTGSGFGASQGNGKVLLGTAYGAVVSWSDTQVVATVALGFSSGSAQIVEGAVSSNALAFNVITPTITSISPAIGAAGTQVTITGSGFEPAQGNGNVWLGSTYASVVSWSDAQVIATVAPGSASGYAQILQNGVWSNSVPFSSSTPHIASVTPASGAAGTQITITGSGFGSSTSTLQLGTMQGSVSSWSDSQIVASVASGSLTGIVQAQQNGTTSNSLRFVVPTSGTGNSDTLVPSLLNLLVGQTRTIQALSPAGTPVTGLTWTSSDSTVVSLSTDDPPILTAVAPGHITITAGDSSSDVTVSSGFALPVGTIIWSAPGDGSGVTSIIPAVPSPSGIADTFAVQASGNVQAITSDGLVAWTANVGTGYISLNADFQGGLVAASPYTVTKYDGITGQQASQYTYSSPGFSNRVYFGTDGTIFTIDGGSVVGIDPATGATKFSVAMRQGSYSSTHTCEYQSTSNGNSLPSVGASTLAGDGYLYVSYEYVNSSDQDAVPSCTGSAGYSTTTGVVLRVGPAGDSTSVILGSFTTSGQTAYFSENQTPFVDYFIQTNSRSGYLPLITAMITNADQGIFATWSLAGTSAYCSEETYYINPPGGFSLIGCVPDMPGQSGIMSLAGSGVASQTTTVDNYGPVLQDVNGIFYGSTNEGSLSAFDQSGNVKWAVTNYSPIMLTSDLGLIAQSNSGQLTTFDQNGVATGLLASLPVLPQLELEKAFFR
jgi:IPT/TIG domain